MAIYNLYIFDKRGTCLLYSEWNRTNYVLKDQPLEDRKLMYGLISTLVTLMNDMSPKASSSTSFPVPSIGEGFNRFVTDSYALFHLETPTGYHFALNCSPNVKDMANELWYIYSELFVVHALRNPLYFPGTPITNHGFINAVDSYIKELPMFK